MKANNQLPVTQELPRVQITSEYDPDHVPLQITIGSAIDAPIISGDFLDNTWTNSLTNAVYYSSSALPLAGGNTIIYAHNTKQLFGKLKNVKVGEIISLQLADKSFHQYEVTNIQVVTTSDISPLQPTQTEQLTLYTCTGPMDSKRLVVTAVPK